MELETWLPAQTIILLSFCTDLIRIRRKEAVSRRLAATLSANKMIASWYRLTMTSPILILRDDHNSRPIHMSPIVMLQHCFDSISVFKIRKSSWAVCDVLCLRVSCLMATCSGTNHLPQSHVQFCKTVVCMSCCCYLAVLTHRLSQLNKSRGKTTHQSCSAMRGEHLSSCGSFLSFHAVVDGLCLQWSEEVVQKQPTQCFNYMPMSEDFMHMATR